MNRVRTAGVAVIALAVLAALALLAPASAGATAGPQQGATVSVGNASGPRGTNVTVPVSARAANVSGYEASLTYDPDVVRVVAVEGGDFSAPVANVDAETGRVNLTQANVDGFDDPTLARITFEVVGAPGNETRLAVDESATALFDPDSVEIHVSTVRSGTVTVTDPDTPTPTSTPTEPTETPSDPDDANAGDGSGPDDSDPPSAGTPPDRNDDEDSGSGLLNSSFVLGAGSVLLVFLIGGVGYYLGSRRSGGSRDRLR